MLPDGPQRESGSLGHARRSEKNLRYSFGISLSTNYTPSTRALLCTYLSSSHPSATTTTPTATWAIHILYKWQIPHHYSASDFRSAIICCFPGTSASIPIRRSSIPYCTILWLWRIRGLLSSCTSTWTKLSTCDKLCERKHRRCYRKWWKPGCLVRRRNRKAKEACRGASQQ